MVLLVLTLILCDEYTKEHIAALRNQDQLQHDWWVSKIGRMKAHATCCWWTKWGCASQPPPTPSTSAERRLIHHYTALPTYILRRILLEDVFKVLNQHREYPKTCSQTVPISSPPIEPHLYRPPLNVQPWPDAPAHTYPPQPSPHQ
jgi:hypothetical protein